MTEKHFQYTFYLILRLIGVYCRAIHMFLAEVTGVQVDEAYMNENGKFELNQLGLVAYSHGEYFKLGKKLGKFGYSVRKK